MKPKTAAIMRAIRNITISTGDYGRVQFEWSKTLEFSIEKG
jgi:hypothetical protein